MLARIYADLSPTGSLTEYRIIIGEATSEPIHEEKDASARWSKAYAYAEQRGQLAKMERRAVLRNTEENRALFGLTGSGIGQNGWLVLPEYIVGPWQYEAQADFTGPKNPLQR